MKKLNFYFFHKFDAPVKSETDILRGFYCLLWILLKIGFLRYRKTYDLLYNKTSPVLVCLFISSNQLLGRIYQ